jgi:hypothetical protein
VESIELVDEKTFKGLVTYPTITTVANTKTSRPTVVTFRDASVRSSKLNENGDSWIPANRGARPSTISSSTLADICVRVSCGVATGADEIFVHDAASLGEDLI